MRKAAPYLFFFVLMLTGCVKFPKESENWDKDYYDYHIGAYIDGVEYHELTRNTIQLLFTPSLEYGFSYLKYPDYNLVRFAPLRERCLFVSSPKNSNCLTLKLYIWVDYVSFDNLIFPAVFSFEGKNAEDYQSFYSSLYSQKSEKLFFVYGAIRRDDNPENWYFAQEGYISIGGFEENGNNDEIVTFEFTAKNNKGEVIEVKQGYINKYVKVR